MLEAALQKAGLVSALITNREMCVTCVAAKAAMNTAAVESTINILGGALDIRRCVEAACDVCGAGTSVVRMERP